MSKPTNTNKKWTTEENDELLSNVRTLRLEGVTENKAFAQVADQLDRPLTGVLAQWDRLVKDGTVTKELLDIVELGPDYKPPVEEPPVIEQQELSLEEMGFEEALRALKEGNNVAREGWNGKGMYVQLYSVFSEQLEPFFIIKNTKGTYNTWVPSVSDLLANDWGIVE